MSTTPHQPLHRRLQQGLVRLAPYGGAALLLGGLVQSRLVESWDLLLYDHTIVTRHHASAKNQPVTIIAISGDDVERYGYPIEDGLLCRAINRASQAGATAIGLDLYRDKGVGPNQACLRHLAQHEPKLVTIFNWNEGVEPIPGSRAERRSYNDLVPDPDGVVRRDLVHVSGQDQATVSFALRLVEVATGDQRLRQQLDHPEQAAASTRWGWLDLANRSGGYRNMQGEAGGYQRLLPFRQPGSLQPSA